MSEVTGFPQLLNLRTPKNNLFSPNFSYMINLDRKAKEFFITDVLKNDKAFVTVTDENGEELRKYLKIKSDFLSLRLDEKSGIDSNSLEKIVSRMSLMGKKKIRMVNKDGLDCIYDLADQRIMSIVKLDNLKHDFDPHFFKDSENYHHDEILLRLIRRSQIYKSWLVHGPLLNLLIEEKECTDTKLIGKPFH